MDTIGLTTEAAANITRLQEEYDAPGFGLRFGIRGGGCSGYKYVLELESEADDDRRGNSEEDDDDWRGGEC